MSAPQHEPSKVDLSGSRWREARARGATVNLVAPHGLKPSAGQLAGSGNDRLYLAIHYRPLPVGDDVPAHVPLGDRGPLLALLDWAKGRGVRTAPAFEALSRSVPPRPVPLLAFHQMIVDVQRECAVSGQTAWGLFPSDRANEPVRVLLPTEPATTLLATPTAAVGVGSTACTC